MAKKKAADTPTSTEYTVLARRYRPQQFEDLVGQEPIAQALVNAIKGNRVAHAYLFTGARGVGKTSTARILAKALNCEKGPTSKPCDQCDMCVAIMSGDDTDVLEIDGASNNGVDQVRELRANVQFRPTRGRFRIYIIDEVHMLTTQAFNALLKTLEEPPAHVKFIFATTEVQKIPVTILSRCQRFDFTGIALPQIVERLREIVTSEDMQADDDALELVARRAAGSMRDAQSLLDQLLAFGGAKLDVDRVHELLGTAHEDRVAELAAALSQRDAKECLAILGRLIDQGQQIGELLDQLLEYWRDLLVVHFAGNEKLALSVTGKHREALKQQAAVASPDSILAGLDLLAAAKSRLRGTSHARVVVEIALVRICQLEHLVALSQLAQWLGKDAGGGPRPLPTATANGPQAQSGASASTAAPEKKKPDAEAELDDRVTLAPENVPAIVQQLISKSGLTLGAEIRKALRVAISAPNTLVFHFPTRYNPRGEQILEGERRTEAEMLLGKITGQACQVRVEVAEDEAGGQAGAAVATQTESPSQRSRRQRSELMQAPLVSKAASVLGAQIVGVDDDYGQVSASPSGPAPESSEDN
jgi:DNA polymerase-3 subunit gamma/tau